MASKKTQLVRINGYPMDLAISEGHTFPGEATKLPVEFGADASDHIRDLPPEITLECIVSDSPSGEVASDPTRDVLAQQGDEPTALPSADALARLREIKALRKPVTIETSLGTFVEMAFIELDVPRDKDKNNALFFTAKFQKINTVTNRRTKTRVRTPMAGAGSGGGPKEKVVVGKSVVIDTVLLWQHDIATGQFVGVVSNVEVHYNRPAGMTRDEALALGGAAPWSPLIDYFDQGSPTPITGERRRKLVDDLQRQAELNSENADKGLGPNAQARRAKNLPPGLNLDRFQQPAPATFDNTLKADDLTRFQRKLPPTIPGT